MYIAVETVIASIKRLREFNPFFGITFLVCKHHGLPVGKQVYFPIDDMTNQFLQRYYKPDYASTHFFHPFETSGSKGGWVSSRYASTGLQSTRTREFKDVFLHEKGTDIWGWTRNYVDVLRAKIKHEKRGPIPALWLAIWLYREQEWPERSTPESAIRKFYEDFNIDAHEQEMLFTSDMREVAGPIFIDQVYSDAELLRYLKPPPDAKPEEGGTLRFLCLEGVGPSAKTEFSPGERLTVITGDNGLGKTFLLECICWALTGKWAAVQATPSIALGRKDSTIIFEIAGKKRLPQKTKIKFDWATQAWPEPKARPTIPGLIIYARVDGSFAVWDPVRHSGIEGGDMGLLRLTRDDVFVGLEGRIEGLLRDWVAWQRNPDQMQFEVFKRVLRRLSPPDLGPLVPDKPVRIALQPREVPTIRHHFGVVPVTEESAGVKRIVTFAYLLVWVWNEHRINSNLARKAPQKNMVVLVDEVEAHLHPKWQRVVLPALLDVAGILSKEVQQQLIVATHSPLIMASLEQTFSEQVDKLYHLQLRSGQVSLREARFIRHGRVDEWLTSEVFELDEARSREGEHAIQQARKLMEADEPTPEAIMAVTTALKRTLAEDDEFWPRWLYFSEQKGVMN